MISTADVLIYISTDSIAMFIFPQMLICWFTFSYFPGDSLSDRGGMKSHCSFYLHFSNLEIF